jgi:excisionase family DNA binding protein
MDALRSVEKDCGMKIELEIPDALAQTIADRVVASLKPVLAGMKPGVQDAILTPNQLADYLQISKQWVYERVSLGEIPHTRVGKYLRFRKSDIDKWMGSRSVPASNPLSRSLKAIE